MGARETVSVSGSSGGVRRATEAFEHFSDTHAVPTQARWRFLVALDEVLSNIVRHGFDGLRGTIDVTFALDERELTVRVEDTAARFNPLLAPAPDRAVSLEERSPGGLGIALVQALMDGVHYEWRDGRNVLTLKWRFDREGTTSHADH
jgi:serine/threonine-protein kinase RsbW